MATQWKKATVVPTSPMWTCGKTHYVQLAGTWFLIRCMNNIFCLLTSLLAMKKKMILVHLVLGINLPPQMVFEEWITTHYISHILHLHWNKNIYIFILILLDYKIRWFITVGNQVTKKEKWTEGSRGRSSSCSSSSKVAWGVHLRPGSESVNRTKCGRVTMNTDSSNKGPWVKASYGSILLTTGSAAF